MKILRALLLVILTTLSLNDVCGQSDKIASQKKIIENLEKQVAAGEREVTTLRKNKATKERELQTLASQIQNRNLLLDAQTQQVKMLQEAISVSEKEHGKLNGELDKQKEAYAEMVREAYRNYRNNNLMSYIFTSEDFVDVARKIVNIRALSQFREERMTKIEDLSTEVLKQKMALEEHKVALDATVKELEKQKYNLVADQKSARSSIASMSSREKKVLQEKELQQRKLDSAISELRKLSKGNTTGATFSAKTSNLNLPVVGGKVKRYMENMAEIVGGANANIVAIYEGKVVDVKHNRITGKYDVYIAHGEYITSYAGLSSVSVAKASNVKKNQIIGVIGQSVDIITMQSEFKLVFGIYPPNPNQKLKASDCFKR